MISCQHVEGSVYLDPHFFAKVQLDDGTVCSVRAFPHDKGKWEYEVSPSDRYFEAMWSFRALFDNKRS